MTMRGALRDTLMFFGGIVASTLIASLAVAPFGIYHFHNTQLFAILANLVAIPICNIIVMPAALATLVAMPVGLEAAPLWVMGWGIEAMVWCAAWVAGLPGAVGRVPAIPTFAFVLMIVGGLWCVLPHEGMLPMDGRLDVN
jgi:competence protein ComEC